MHWKNWPYWVKGAILSLVIFAILLFIQFQLSDYRNSHVWLNYLRRFFSYIPVAITWKLIVPLSCKVAPHCLNPDLVTAISLYLIEYLGIGALLGYLYGKIKNRDKARVNGNIS